MSVSASCAARACSSTWPSRRSSRIGSPFPSPRPSPAPHSAPSGTMSPPPSPSGESRPADGRRLTTGLLALLAALAALRLLAAAVVPLTEDEAYYRLWSTAPRLGYYD